MPIQNKLLEHSLTVVFRSFFVSKSFRERSKKTLLCQFERLIYPQSVSTIDAGSFMIAVYRPCEKIKDSAGDLVTQVKAVGYGLPIADKQRYELQGHWSKNPKHGVQF